MSVHAEYGRALEALHSDLLKLRDSAHASSWIERLESARVSESQDLSSAATACLELLEAIDRERALTTPTDVGPDLDALREPFLHLRSHCFAILGQRDPLADTL